MNWVIKYLLLTFFLVEIFSVFGQTHYNLPPKKFYQNATIGFTSFQKIEVDNLVISNDSLSYSRKGVAGQSHMDEINYIRVVEGTKAKDGALIGGISMLVISLGSILQVESDPNYELRENVGGLVGLYTLGGTVVGALIGGAIQRKTSYYTHAMTNNYTGPSPFGPQE